MPVDWAHHLLPLGPDNWAQSVSRLGPASWTIGPTPSRLGPPDLFWLCYQFIFPAITVYSESSTLDLSGAFYYIV